jgi:hypothetical protein
MIKNILIVLLIAGLSWLTLANTHEKTEMQAGFHAKFEQLKKQMSRAYEAAQQEEKKQKTLKDGKVSQSGSLPKVPGKKIIIENSPDHDEPVRQSAGNTNKDNSDTPLAKEILSGLTKKKEKRLSALSDSEFSSIQSTLRSALKILNKASFPASPEKGVTPSKEDSVKIERVKKKSDTGLEELVSMSTSL